MAKNFLVFELAYEGLGHRSKVTLDLEGRIQMPIAVFWYCKREKCKE